MAKYRCAELYHACEYCGAGVGEACHVVDESDKVYRDKHGTPWSHRARRDLVDEAGSAPRSH
jgi:hypothetical protein